VTSQETPLVSLLIAMKNESAFIADTLTAVFAQDYPAEKIEVVVADGGSTDDSREIVAQLFAGRPNTLLLDNPQISASCGWNLGIARCRGDIIGIVSAHCELAPDYLRQAVETLERTGVDLVGGPMVATGEGSTAQAIALATSSPFGVGDARFHYLTDEEEVDTVYQGMCWRDLYVRLGAFDPEMVHDQDDELSFRINAAGGRIVCNPRIRSKYHCRSTLRALYRQYFQYGFWKVPLIQKWPRQMRARHFIPPVFAAAVVALPLLGLLWAPMLWGWLFMLGAYAVGSVVATIASARGGASSGHLVVPLVFPVLHLGYGFGFLTGLLSWPFRAVRS
jgi:succinoglycan biosynthesis protein ExoA